MRRVKLETFPLYLPSVIGARVQTMLPIGATVRGVLMVGRDAVLSVEVPCDPETRTFETREFVLAIGGFEFELPAGSQYVGAVAHPRHGPVYVYDVRP